MGTEIQDFAAALVALKERSGMSYGTLAKRLHMSTSTVHRYCNGDAVPHDYAPVERLARLCRATPDELVGLHRQWILADQAKKAGGTRKVKAATPAATVPSWARPADAEEGEGAADEADEAADDGRTAGGTESAASAVDTSRRPETESGTGGETEPDRSGEGEPVPTVPTPAPAPAPAGPSAAASGVLPTGSPATRSPAPASPAPGRRGRRASGADSAERSEPAEPLVTGGEGREGGGAGRPRPRRTRVLLAAAVVVALSVPSALVARHLAGGNDDGRNADATGATATTGSPTPSRKPSGTPSVSASASASASTRPSPPASTTGAATPVPPAKEEAAAASDAVPLSASITSYNWDSPCGQYYLLGDDANDVPPPPPQDARSWAKALGGVDGGSQLLEVTVQGSSSQAVVVSALHVRVQSRKAPLAWNSFSMGEGCGSAIVPWSFDIDLDDSRPRTKPVAGQQGDAVVPAQDFPFRTSSTDVQVFHLDAHVEGHDVSWYLELDWTSGDRSGTLRVDDHGEPFRTSSIKARPGYVYWADRAQWMSSEYVDPALADEGE
ncbi:helix-turn-helix domain-containing protein [Streptomyces sp. NBC_00101]|uniref:helix-turn-helix domain-containing protein n=1 Tax=Streptomyces sp. NBC_00101 TaxID=2975651 RepID=UPI003244AC3D